MSLLDSWNKPVEFTFASGRKAMLRRIDPIELLRETDGSLPTPIANVLIAAAGATPSEEDGQPPSMTPQELVGFWDIMNQISAASFVDPEIGPEVGKLPLHLITPGEKMQVFRFQVGMEAASLTRFPVQGQASGVYTLEDVGEVGAEPE